MAHSSTAVAVVPVMPWLRQLVHFHPERMGDRGQGGEQGEARSFPGIVISADNVRKHG
jgi:hypothetical protein